MRDNDWQEVGGGAVEVVVLEASSLGSGCMMAGLYSATRNMCDLARALAWQTLTEYGGLGLPGFSRPQLQLQSGPARCGLETVWPVRHILGSDGTDSVSPLSLSLSLLSLSCQQQRDSVCLSAC